MEPQGSLTRSQEPAPDPNLRQIKTSPHPPIYA